MAGIKAHGSGLAMALILWAVVVLVVNWTWPGRCLRARLAVLLGIDLLLAAVIVGFPAGCSACCGARCWCLA
jgi:hypothetical protein